MITEQISATNEWRKDADCRDVESLFDATFDLPTHGAKLTSADRAVLKRAKAVCDGCPVKPDCLKYAIRHEDVWGVHGGLAPHQKSALIKQAKKTARNS